MFSKKNISDNGVKLAGKIIESAEKLKKLKDLKVDLQ